METRQENPPVSMSGLRSAEPCARDPPPACRGVTNAASRAFGGCHGNPPGEDLPKCKASNRERRCDNIASPERRTREASPSYS